MSRTPYQRHTDLMAARLKDPGKFGPDSWCAVQEVMYAALWEHGSGVRPLPEEMAVALAFAMRDVVAGFETELFKPVRHGPGQPGRSPTELSCIEAAVRYKRAVDGGLIDDDKPIKTIVDEYRGPEATNGGLDRTTVQGWMRDQRFAEVQPDDIWPDWLREERGRFIEAAMKFSGSHYRQNFSKVARAQKRRHN